MDEGTLAWLALQRVRGMGPRKLAALARRLAEQRRGAADLLGASAEELQALGVSAALAEAAAESLSAPEAEPAPPGGVQIVTPDHEAYPAQRLDGPVPLPVVLYVLGDPSLLASSGVAVAGSRSAPEPAVEFARALASAAARSGLNVVSGHAAGIDEAAHAGALEAGGTTTAVLAEGIGKFKPKAGLRSADPEGVLIVSQFPPDANWTPHRAMERNATITALADAVVVVAAGTKGGSWEQGQLCLKAGKLLGVPDFEAGIAPGNRALIKAGAIALNPADPARALDVIVKASLDAERQTSLFG